MRMASHRQVSKYMGQPEESNIVTICLSYVLSNDFACPFPSTHEDCRTSLGGGTLH